MVLIIRSYCIRLNFFYTLAKHIAISGTDLECHIRGVEGNLIVIFTLHDQSALGYVKPITTLFHFFTVCSEKSGIAC